LSRRSDIDVFAVNSGLPPHVQPSRDLTRSLDPSRGALDLVDPGDLFRAFGRFDIEIDYHRLTTAADNDEVQFLI
jgi:hypothetical protein